MGQKVNPVGFRTGIMIGWKSRWYASKKEFGSLILEDFQVRKFIKQKFKSAGISKVEIERTRSEVIVVLHAAQLEAITREQTIDNLQAELQTLVGRRISLKLKQINHPEIHAQLVAEGIAAQLSKRASFRRAMKRSADQTMEAGAKGIKIQLAGRLGGSEAARREKLIVGAVPLSTLRAKIDYGFMEASTTQGSIGIQVWINQGMEKDASEQPTTESMPHGWSLFTDPAKSMSDLIRRVEAGLPYSVWERFARSSTFPNEVLAKVVDLPLSTLSRRKKAKRLTANESDRLVRVARVFELACDLFEGSVEKSRHWLSTPQSALGGAKPLEFAATDIGAREVETLIGRLEHGILA